MRKVRFCGQTINPPPHVPRPCNTIKNCEWGKMDCSLPSHSVVLLLDGIIGPRWQARRQEASSSSIWPSGRWSGLQLPAWVLSRCVSHFFWLEAASFPCRALPHSHFGPAESAGSYRRRGSSVFPSGVLFYTNMCWSEDIYEYSIRVIFWSSRMPGWVGGGVQTSHTVSLLLPISFYSNRFFPVEIKFYWTLRAAQKRKRAVCHLGWGRVLC